MHNSIICNYYDLYKFIDCHLYLVEKNRNLYMGVIKEIRYYKNSYNKLMIEISFNDKRKFIDSVNNHMYLIN